MEMIELSTGSFSAIVVPFKAMPFTKLTPIFEQPDGFSQFMKGVEILRDQVAVELRPNFDALTGDDLALVMQQWMESKNEG